MICRYCMQPTVEWKGPLTALTHTECSTCGATNCQRLEHEEPESNDDASIDDLIGGNS